MVSTRFIAINVSTSRTPLAWLKNGISINANTFNTAANSDVAMPHAVAA